ncbi:small serum protein 5-like isoform X1 [Thamnophis elegans]|uniref:small serum protein 5-like isoform X1 n=1 Tax=Thamnophis elegans TaxID=35005 RepID=UPI001378AC5E|nr:small serum protein 5-like isoform X1 [Thamnophis elegans]
MGRSWFLYKLEDQIPFWPETSAAPCPPSLPRVSLVSPKAKMKVFFSLIIFSLVLASCQGACFSAPFAVEFKNGTVVFSSTCLDRFDGRKHLIGSTWNTAHCFKCECTKFGMDCCHRYGGRAGRQGCKAVVNPVTCEYEFYRLDDPSQRCGG